jgi:hypothetical protein
MTHTDAARTDLASHREIHLTLLGNGPIAAGSLSTNRLRGAEGLYSDPTVQG